MTGRRRFTPAFKAKVALRGDRTIQEIASRHQVHPNQVGTWKRHAADGLAELFAGGSGRRRATHEAEIHDLHARIGQLVVERDFFYPRGSSVESARARGVASPRRVGPELEPPMRAAVGLSRSSAYDQPTGESPETLVLMRWIDELYLQYPFYGSRQMVRHLRADGQAIGCHRIRRLMRRIGLQAIDQAPKTSKPHPEHRVYPYRLRDVVIERPDHVWCADITYIPMRRGFLYLVVVMDWASRFVLAWELSNTQDAALCDEALGAALDRYGKPEIVNTDQGSQFTSDAFTGALTEAGVTISMDGRGRLMDNIFIEWLWRSLKYEAVHRHDLADGLRARQVIDDWLAFYNATRPHSSLGGRTPCDAYEAGSPAGKAIALPADPQTRQSREKTVDRILAE